MDWKDFVCAFVGALFTLIKLLLIYIVLTSIIETNYKVNLIVEHLQIEEKI